MSPDEPLILDPRGWKVINLQAMPTYVYICEKCGHQFEKSQSFQRTVGGVREGSLSAEALGQSKVKRAITSGAGLIFKASGFYITDYRSDKYKEAAKKDSATPATPADKPSVNSDAKPAPCTIGEPCQTTSGSQDLASLGLNSAFEIEQPSLRAAYGALLALMVTSSVRHNWARRGLSYLAAPPAVPHSIRAVIDCLAACQCLGE